jgi:putative transposase
VKPRRIGTGAHKIVRRRAMRKHDVWAMDCLRDWTLDRRWRILVVLDEYTRECLAFEVRWLRRGKDVVAVLEDLTAI